MIAPPVERPGRDGTRPGSNTWSSPETADLVHAWLLERATDQLVTASIGDLCDALGIGAGTAKRAIRRLLDEHRIELLRRGTGGKYSSRYRICAAGTGRSADGQGS